MAATVTLQTEPDFAGDASIDNDEHNLAVRAELEERARRVLNVRSLVHRYITDRVRQREIRVVTASSLWAPLIRFAEVCGDRQLRFIGKRDVERWLVASNHLSAATRRSQLSTLRGFCRWLVDHKLLTKDPTVGFRIRVPRRVPRAMHYDAVTRLVAEAPDRRALVICLLMVQEGLRRGEVCRLEAGDLDRNTGAIRVTGKGGHERVLPLSTETMEALNEYLAEHPATSGPLVRSYSRPWAGLQPTTVSRIVSECMYAAGVKHSAGDGVSAHALRHTAATDMLRNGAHLRDVQAALGHAHLSSTEIYIPLVVHSLSEAMGGRSYRHPETKS